MKKGRKGISYIFVTIVITITTSIIIMLYTNSKLAIDTSILYSEYSNDYYMAISGIERLNAILNQDLYKDIENILKDANERILRSDIEDYLYYDNYSFYFKRKNSVNQYGEVNRYYKDMIIKQFYYRYPQHYSNNFAFTIENGIEDYLIEVSYKVENDNFLVKSKSENLKNNIFTEVESKISLEQGYEKVKFDFTWYNIMIPFTYSIVCQNLIVDVNSQYFGNILSEYSYNIQSSESLQTTNNIIITESIDIGELAEEYYIIFSNNDISLNNSSNNNFKGVIISCGDIVFNNYNGSIRGNVIANNNIYLKNSNIEFINEEDVIFKVRYGKEEVYFKILDCLGVTNFKSITSDVATKAGIRSILNNIKIDNIKGVNLENLQFKAKETIQN